MTNFRNNLPFRIAIPRISLDNRLVGISLVMAVLMALAQSATRSMVDYDGYYHIKMAYLMQSTLTPNFIWLPLTILNPAAYYDHHFLFHVLLIPFTFGDLIIGAKIALVIFAALALTTAYVLMRSQRIPGAEMWTVAIFASSYVFVYRMSMVRVQSLSLLWLLAALYLLFNRRDSWLIPLGLTYVWLYDAFPLLLVVCGVYFIAARFIEGEWRWKSILFPTLGIILGLVANPYFPRDIAFIYHHLIAKLDIQSVSVGSEWYPYTTVQLLKNGGIALLAFIAGAFALGWQRQRLSLAAAVLLGLSILFGYMLFQSRRFIEYFPPFAVLFCAFAWHPILSGRAIRWYAVAAIAIALPVATFISLKNVRADISDSPAVDTFAGSSAWLISHTPPQSLVFQTDWDDFPQQFFYNTHNTYIVGLDATYLSLADEGLYKKWVDLTQGRSDHFANDIQTTFNTCFAITDLKHRSFIDKADKDPQFKQVYKDDKSAVYQFCQP